MRKVLSSHCELAHTHLITMDMADSDHELFPVILITVPDAHFTKEQKSPVALVNIPNTNKSFHDKGILKPSGEPEGASHL